MHRVRIALQLVEPHLRLAVGRQLALGGRDRPLQRGGALAGHRGLGLHVRDDALHLALDLAVDVGELALRLQEVGVAGAVAALHVGYLLADLGALGAQLRDDRAVEGRRHVLPRAALGDLGAGGGELGLLLGRVGPGRGELGVERGDLQPRRGVALRGGEEAVLGLERLDLGVGLLRLLAQAVEARGDPAVGLGVGADLGRQLVGQILASRSRSAPAPTSPGDCELKVTSMA